ncbi:hypothetical protein [Mesobacillus subterraneus]|uniref:Uncharacterized protein n=1 Tax=Mesobacillus subterraneus TaxID=285983 RepID=A0A427TP51_9BACI|nr:hypothetical protein [Mesobacillus subterraneus]RSD26146.1 hypothetical protein EJA10_15090 [Mesobacillus subterraneus]
MANQGCVYEIQLSDLREMEKGIAGHNFHLFHALSNKQGILVGVEPFEVEFHFGLSNGLKEKMPEIKEKIRTLIHGKAAEYTNGHG